jgi:hypothetical protein
MPPLLETLALGKIYSILEAPEWSDWIPIRVLGRGGRWVRQTRGEIPSVHVYCDEEKGTMWI